jgi:hypothetical protein
MPIDTGPPTEEERALVAGMPNHVAAGFIAARRGGDVRDLHEQNARIKDMEGHLDDILKGKREGNPLADVTGEEVQQAFMDQMAKGNDQA